MKYIYGLAGYRNAFAVKSNFHAIKILQGSPKTKSVCFFDAHLITVKEMISVHVKVHIRYVFDFEDKDF
jgi:hypothetical protein